MLRALALAALLALTACAAPNLDLTPEGRLFELQGEFNILLEQMETYAAQPFCDQTPSVACADRDVVIALSEGATVARSALLVARTAMQMDMASAANLAAAARAAVAALSKRLVKEIGE